MRFSSRVLIVLSLLLLVAAPVQAQTESPQIGDPVSLDGASTGPQRDFSGCTRIDVAAVNSAYEQQVVELVNQERWNNGQLPPLKRNTLLDLAARYHAKDMSDDNYFNHDSYDGSTKVCAWSGRIANWYPSYSSLAENIAWGYGSPSSVMSGWMGSTGHKNNILSTGNREIGVGYYTGSLWVQDFGRKNSVYPIVINREAAQTDTYQVNLYIYGQGTITQMRLKNDNDAWGGWIPFNANMTWNLPQLKGTRTVTVELKTSSGTVYTSSDEIYLTNGAELGGLPGSLLFIYDQSEGKFYPTSYNLNPQNTGGALVLTWSIQAANPWVAYNPSGGPTPNSVAQVSISGLDTSTVGQYNSSITITVTNPAGTLNSPKVISVQVGVVANLNNKIYLSVVNR